MLTLTSHTETTTLIVIDIFMIECVVGRVWYDIEWDIIDMSNNFSVSIFVSTIFFFHICLDSTYMFTNIF